MYPRGSITTEHTIWCSVCNRWDQICERTMARTIQVAKKNGWRKINDYWVCLSCLEKRKRDENE